MERDISADDTARIQRVHIGSNEVGTVFIYEQHCDAIPADKESQAYSFSCSHAAAHWLRLLVIDAEEAEDWLIQHARDTAEGVG